MSESISKYFTSKIPIRGSKRKTSSSSSDPLTSPTNLAVEKPDQKKKKTKAESPESQTCDSDSLDDMEDIQTTLNCINDKLLVVSTKDDLQSLRAEMKDEISKLSASVSHRLDRLEHSLFTLAEDKDRLDEELKQLKRENGDLKSRLEMRETEDRRLRAAHNDLEQHGRLWNVRVYGVREDANPGEEETATVCVRKCVEIFSKQVGVAVKPGDVEVAHRSGRPAPAGSQGSARPRPILVRFFSRQVKRNVLENRKKLKQSGISISEDLTLANYKLLKKASEHSGTMSAWSSNGKVLTKLKNGLVVPLNINDDINEIIKRKLT